MHQLMQEHIERMWFCELYSNISSTLFNQFNLPCNYFMRRICACFFFIRFSLFVCLYVSVHFGYLITQRHRSTGIEKKIRTNENRWKKQRMYKWNENGTQIVNTDEIFIRNHIIKCFIELRKWIAIHCVLHVSCFVILACPISFVVNS